MVELGDLREGIMPGDLENAVRETLRFPNIALKGIGTNLACRSGVSPDARNMAELSALADSIDATFGLTMEIVSGGNSANLTWRSSGADTGRINDLRLGESILLGREPLHRQPIDGLHTDAITLVAEVIESKVKPSQPWGEIAQTAFGEATRHQDRGLTSRRRSSPSGARTPIRAASTRLPESRSSGPAATTSSWTPAATACPSAPRSRSNSTTARWSAP